MGVAPFAKLFDTPHGQVLYVLDDTDDDEPCIRVRGGYCNGVKPEAVLRYNDEAPRDAAFAIIGQDMAEETAAKLAALVARLGSPT